MPGWAAGSPGGAVTGGGVTGTGVAATGVVEPLEHHDDGALPEDEAVAILVERARGPLGLVVAGREGAEAGQGDEREREDGRLGPAGQEGLSVAAPQGMVSLVEGVDAGRASGDARHGRALQTEGDRDLAGGHVGDHRGDQERADPVGAAGEERLGLAGGVTVATATGRDVDADVVGVLGPDLQPGVVESLAGGGHRELGEAAHPPRGLRLDVVARLEPFDLSRDLDLELRRIEAGDPADAGDAARQVAPGLRDAVADRRDGAKAGHHDAIVVLHQRAIIEAVPGRRAPTPTPPPSLGEG